MKKNISSKLIMFLVMIMLVLVFSGCKSELSKLEDDSLEVYNLVINFSEYETVVNKDSLEVIEVATSNTTGGFFVEISRIMEDETTDVTCYFLKGDIIEPSTVWSSCDDDGTIDIEQVNLALKEYFED